MPTGTYDTRAISFGAKTALTGLAVMGMALLYPDGGGSPSRLVVPVVLASLACGWFLGQRLPVVREIKAPQVPLLKRAVSLTPHVGAFVMATVAILVVSKTSLQDPEGPLHALPAAERAYAPSDRVDLPPDYVVVPPASEPAHSAPVQPLPNARSRARGSSQDWPVVDFQASKPTSRSRAGSIELHDLVGELERERDALPADSPRRKEIDEKITEMKRFRARALSRDDF